MELDLSQSVIRQQQRPQAGFCLCAIRLHQNLLTVDVGRCDDMADGQCSRVQIDRDPAQAQYLASAQPVECRELNDQLQSVPPRSGEQLLHLLGSVASGHILLYLRALHLVHRIAGNEIEPHRVFQRLV